MSHPVLSLSKLESARAQFVAELPRLERIFRFWFRNRPARHRHAAVAAARVAAWIAWYGLVRRGRDPRAVGPLGIAHHAARSVARGRGLGSGKPGPQSDALRPQTQRRAGFQVFSLDLVPPEAAGRAGGGWRDWLAEDNRSTPADEAAFRIDFTAWLAVLPSRLRRAAELLADGWSTGEVAAALGVTSGAISQTRVRLAANWHRFQGGDERCP